MKGGCLVLVLAVCSCFCAFFGMFRHSRPTELLLVGTWETALRCASRYVGEGRKRKRKRRWILEQRPHDGEVRVSGRGS